MTVIKSNFTPLNSPRVCTRPTGLQSKLGMYCGVVVGVVVAVVEVVKVVVPVVVGVVVVVGVMSQPWNVPAL